MPQAAHLSSSAGDAINSTKEKEAWDLSPENPYNWKQSARWTNALIISFTGFLSTAGSSAFVPANAQLATQFGETDTKVVLLSTSLYVLALGVGPFVFGPISELYGKQISYTIGMSLFTISHIACSVVNNLPGLIALRFLSGCFGSVGPCLGMATISDLFRANERGRPASIYAIGPMLGPAFGSLLGSYLALLGWRWILRVLAIATFLNTLAVVFLMQETYHKVIQQRLLKIASATGSRRKRDRLKISTDVRAILVHTFTRPTRMLMNPLCLIFVLYYSYLYGIIYAFLVVIPLLFSSEERNRNLHNYGWPNYTWGLAYLSLAVGFLSAAATAATMQDKIYKRLTKKYNEERADYRLVLTQVGMIVFPLGMFIFAWTANSGTHWIAPAIGCSIFAYGLMLAFNSIQNWIVDNYYPYSSSAMAAASALRSIAGCILPLFSRDLFINLGWGKGATLLACLALPVVPVPFILFIYGPYLRKRYAFLG